MLKSEVRKILDIVADLSRNDVKKDVLETEIISQWTRSKRCKELPK